MAVLTVSSIKEDGAATLTQVNAASGGDEAAMTGNEIIVVTNGGGSSITATLTAVGKCNQGTLHDVAVAVGAGLTRYLRVKDIDRFRNGNTNNVNWTYSGVTTVTVGVISFD